MMRELNMSQNVFALLSCIILILLGLSQIGYTQNFMVNDGDSIVFLGDSITQQGAKPEGYVSLFKLFCDHNGYDVTVINSGIGGHRSNDMLKRLKKDVIDHNPTWVSISCGVNDVWHSFKTPPRGVELTDYKKNMTDIVDQCKEAGIKVLLLTSTPIYEDLNSKENVKLRKYNDFLRKLAKEKEVLLCDLFETFESWYKVKLRDDKLMTTDGVHMNPRGNRVMAAKIISTLGAKWRELAQAKKRWELVNNMQSQ
jgi:lysophospholipase L1-like esterase